MIRTLHKTRLEGDSTTAADVPNYVDLLGGYLDGNYVTVPALRKRKPPKRIVTYTVNGSTPGADMIDCEKGDAIPTSAARYVSNERKAGNWPGIYFPLSDIAAVCGALHSLGLGPDVPLQTAHYTGKAHVCGKKCLAPYGPLPFVPLIVATQYATPGIGVTGHFDLSAVDDDYWPDRHPVPRPAKQYPLTRRHRWMARVLTVAFNKRGSHPPPSGDRLILADLATAAGHAAKQK